MTMHIYFLQTKDGYEEGWSGFVERSLARRFCENAIAVPYQDHLQQVADEKAAASEAKRKQAAEASEKRAAAAKKHMAAKKQNAVSKKAAGRSKATP